jgi:hypothetical protein
MAETEGKHPGEFIISEANGHRSREVVTIDNGADLVAGTVLGKITVGGKYIAADQDAGDGSDAAVAILYADAAAASAEVQAVVIVRDAEVNRDELTFHANNDAGEITELIGDLATVGIIVRESL